MNTLDEKIKIFQEILEKTEPNEIIVLSHADHDGLTSDCLIDLLYYDSYKSFIKRFHPSKEFGYSAILYKVLSLKPKYFLIIDALVKPYEKIIKKILDQGGIVINLDHHDLLSIKDENYLDLNPHNWNLEYMNSSGLVWLIAKKFNERFFRERSWVAGIGAIQDYCIEDNKELMEELRKRGYIEEVNLVSALNSKLLQIAKVINSSYFSTNTIYQMLFQAAYINNPEKLITDRRFIKALEIYRSKLNKIYEEIKKEEKIIWVGDIKLKIYDLKGKPIQLISDICEIEKEDAIYIGYSNGLLGFRSLFYPYDVRKLARLFEGGGPHPRVGGAQTNKSLDNIIKEIIHYLEDNISRKTLDEFM